MGNLWGLASIDFLQRLFFDRLNYVCTQSYWLFLWDLFCTFFLLFHKGTKMKLIVWIGLWSLSSVGYLHMQRRGSLLEVCVKLSTFRMQWLCEDTPWGRNKTSLQHIYVYSFGLFFHVTFCFLPCFYLMASRSPYLTLVKLRKHKQQEKQK